MRAQRESGPLTAWTSPCSGQRALEWRLSDAFGAAAFKYSPWITVSSVVPDSSRARLCLDGVADPDTLTTTLVAPSSTKRTVCFGDGVADRLPAPVSDAR